MVEQYESRKVYLYVSACNGDIILSECWYECQNANSSNCLFLREAPSIMDCEVPSTVYAINPSQNNSYLPAKSYNDVFLFLFNPFCLLNKEKSKFFFALFSRNF